MKKENIRKLLEVKKEVRYNDKMSDLIDDVIVDECGEGLPMPKMVAVIEKQIDEYDDEYDDEIKEGADE